VNTWFYTSPAKGKCWHFFQAWVCWTEHGYQQWHSTSLYNFGLHQR